MLKITKQNNSIVVEGVNNYKYPDNAVLSFPLNSIICEVDESDIITFHSASNYDVLFSGNVSEITINGESVTKENVGDKFGAISNAASGGGGLTPEQEEKLNNAVQTADYNADKAAQSAIDEGQNAAIEGLSGNLEGKQDKINDLDAIREGAGKGATAIQSETDPVWQSEKGNYYTKGETDGLVDEAKASAASAMSVASSAEGIASTANSKADEALGKLETKADKTEIPSLDGYATEQWVGEQGYLTEHQDISGKLDKTEAAEIYQPKGNYATKDEIPSLVGYATEQWVGEQGYLTEHQQLKTINGETIVGDGNIIIESGGDVYGVYMDPNYGYNKFGIVIEKNGEYIKNANVSVKLFDVNNGLTSPSITKTNIWYFFEYYSGYLAASILIKVDGKTIYGTVVPLHTNLQQKLKSGSNIKTINGQSIIGSGNIEIQGGGITEETDPIWAAEKVNYYTKDEADGKFLTEHQDISGKLDKTEAEATYQKKGEYVNVNTYNQHITDQTAVDEAQNSAIQGIEGNITRIDSKADNALEGLNSKADKADIKVYDSKHPSEVADENAIILNVVGSSYDLNNADNWRLITVPNAKQIYGYYFGVKVSDITSEEKEIGRLIPEQGEGYVTLTVIRNGNTVTFKSTPSASNMGYCNYRLYIHSVNDNISLEIASYNSEQSVLINLADNDYIIALGFEEAYGSGKFLTNGLYASTYGQNTILIKANQKNVDNLIKRVQSYSSDTDSIDFEYTNDNRYSVHFKKINGKSIFDDGNIITGAPNYVVDKEISEIPNGKGVAIDIRPNKVYLDLPNGTPHTVTAEEASKKYGCNFNNRRSIFFVANGRILVIENIDGYISVSGNDGILTMYNATTNEPTTSVESNNYYIKLIEGASLANNNNWNPLYYEEGEPIEGLNYVKDSTPHKIALEDNLKTINGQSIIGSGNIEIQGGGGITEETDPIWTAEKVNYYTKAEIDEMIGNINNALATLING